MGILKFHRIILTYQNDSAQEADTRWHTPLRFSLKNSVGLSILNECTLYINSTLKKSTSDFILQVYLQVYTRLVTGELFVKLQSHQWKVNDNACVQQYTIAWSCPKEWRWLSIYKNGKC